MAVDRFIAFLFSLPFAGAAFADGAAASGPAASAAESGVCARHMPAPPAHCRWVEGSLSVYDGTPPVRLKIKGAKGLQAVGPSEDEWMPESLRARLTPDNRIDARLRICPMPAQPPRGLRQVCIDEARDVRVQAP